MMITWKDIFSAIGSKLFGSAQESKFRNDQMKLLFSEHWKLKHEQDKAIDDYKKQLEEIKQLKKNHPDNGKELDMWKDREYQLMMTIVEKNKQITYLNERCIFLERENDMFHRKREVQEKRLKGSGEDKSQDD
jgi:hypothetical protein